MTKCSTEVGRKISRRLAGPSKLGNASAIKYNTFYNTGSLTLQGGRV